MKPKMGAGHHLGGQARLEKPAIHLEHSQYGEVAKPHGAANACRHSMRFANVRFSRDKRSPILPCLQIILQIMRKPLTTDR